MFAKIHHCWLFRVLNCWASTSASLKEPWERSVLVLLFIRPTTEEIAFPQLWLLQSNYKILVQVLLSRVQWLENSWQIPFSYDCHIRAKQKSRFYLGACLFVKALFIDSEVLSAHAWHKLNLTGSFTCRSSFTASSSLMNVTRLFCFLLRNKMYLHDTCTSLVSLCGARTSNLSLFFSLIMTSRDKPPPTPGIFKSLQWFTNLNFTDKLEETLFHTYPLKNVLFGLWVTLFFSPLFVLLLILSCSLKT